MPGGKSSPGMTISQQVICYQIAGLYLMAQTGQIDDPNAFFGIVSPTGQRWYKDAMLMNARARTACYIRCRDGDACAVPPFGISGAGA